MGPHPSLVRQRFSLGALREPLCPGGRGDGPTQDSGTSSPPTACANQYQLLPDLLNVNGFLHLGVVDIWGGALFVAGSVLCLVDSTLHLCPLCWWPPDPSGRPVMTTRYTSGRHPIPPATESPLAESRRFSHLFALCLLTLRGLGKSLSRSHQHRRFCRGSPRCPG